MYVLFSMLVVFEGIDLSGKETQAKLLKSKLEVMNRNVKLIDFPHYDSLIGAMIRNYLHNNVDFDLRALALLFAADRYAQSNRIESWLSQDVDVIFDRYYFSNVAYQGISLPIDWLVSLDSLLPKPDFVIYIDILPEESFRRNRGVKDRNESKLDFLARVRSNYLKILSGDLKIDNVPWYKIDGMQPIDDVFNDVWDVVSKYV